MCDVMAKMLEGNICLPLPVPVAYDGGQGDEEENSSQEEQHHPNWLVSCWVLINSSCWKPKPCYKLFPKNKTEKQQLKYICF